MTQLVDAELLLEQDVVQAMMDAMDTTLDGQHVGIRDLGGLLKEGSRITARPDKLRMPSRPFSLHGDFMQQLLNASLDPPEARAPSFKRPSVGKLEPSPEETEAQLSEGGSEVIPAWMICTPTCCWGNMCPMNAFRDEIPPSCCCFQESDSADSSTSSEACSDSECTERPRQAISAGPSTVSLGEATSRFMDVKFADENSPAPIRLSETDAVMGNRSKLMLQGLEGELDCAKTADVDCDRQDVDIEPGPVGNA